MCATCFARPTPNNDENEARWKANRKKRNEELRKQKREHVNAYKLAYGCCKCGYNKCTNALHFHHTHDKTKEISRMVQQSYSMDRLVEEMRKCIILCANCHAEHHATQQRGDSGNPSSGGEGVTP
jgi:hypothetical protein